MSAEEQRVCDGVGQIRSSSATSQNNKSFAPPEKLSIGSWVTFPPATRSLDKAPMEANKMLFPHMQRFERMFDQSFLACAFFFLKRRLARAN